MHRRILEPAALTEGEKRQMLALMTRYYDGVCPGAFARDLAEKTHCILLQGPSGEVLGFSTQRVMALAVGGGPSTGCSPATPSSTRTTGAASTCTRPSPRPSFPWRKPMMTSTGSSSPRATRPTRCCPCSFRATIPATGRPRRRRPGPLWTPSGRPNTRGIRCGRRGHRLSGEKDRLKPGFADIEPRHQKDEAIRFFQAVNPDHRRGNDLVCLASLKEANLKGTARRLFLGR